MHTNDWYRTHQKYGWQEIVAQELALNPTFQPVIECRKGKIRRNKSVKWRLTTTTYSTQWESLSWRPRQEFPRSPVELPGISVIRNTKETPEGTTPATSVSLLYQAAQSNRQLMESKGLLSSKPTVEQRQPKENHVGDSGARLSQATGKGPLEEAGALNCLSTRVAESSGLGMERSESYDKPIEMGLGETTCNGSTPAH